MLNLRVPFIAVCFLLISIPSFWASVMTDGAELGKWTMDYDAAMALAKKEQKPVLINFTGSDWCGWCKLMDKGVFAEADWSKYAKENIVLVTIDFPRDKSIVPAKYVERNDTLKNKYGIRGYPTYVLLDSDAKTKVAQLGAGQDKTAKSFISEIEVALKTSVTGLKKYEKDYPEKYKAFKAAIDQLKAREADLAKWIETKPPRNPENMKKYEGFQTKIKAAQAEVAKF